MCSSSMMPTVFSTPKPLSPSLFFTKSGNDRQPWVLILIPLFHQSQPHLGTEGLSAPICGPVSGPSECPFAPRWTSLEVLSWNHQCDEYVDPWKYGARMNKPLVSPVAESMWRRPPLGARIHAGPAPLSRGLYWCYLNQQPPGKTQVEWKNITIS